MGALRDTENALRDFVDAVLSARFGRDWIERCGATPDRVQKWTEHKTTEARRFAPRRLSGPPVRRVEINSAVVICFFSSLLASCP